LENYFKAFEPAPWVWCQREKATGGGALLRGLDKIAAK
jgi:hypothetical protein